MNEDLNKDEMAYRTILGMNSSLTGARIVPSLLEGMDEVDSPLDNDTAEEEFEEPQTLENTYEHKRPIGETTEERKQRKQIVKEARREKRKTKVPKHIKKQRNKSNKK